MPRLIIACFPEFNLWLIYGTVYGPAVVGGALALICMLKRALDKNRLSPLLLPEIIAVPAILSAAAGFRSGVSEIVDWSFLFGITLLGTALGWAMVRWRGWTRPARVWPSLIAMPAATITLWGIVIFCAVSKFGVLL